MLHKKNFIKTRFYFTAKKYTKNEEINFFICDILKNVGNIKLPWLKIKEWYMMI